MKRKTIKADEYDLAFGFRRFLGYMQRPGATSAIKRRVRRRERHDAKHDLRRDDDA